MMINEKYSGYLFAYFKGEGNENGEQVYFAISKGNDPLHWEELHAGAPVLTSTLGEEGVRDPFLVRSPINHKFYLLATDLKIHGNGDWNRAVTRGSKSIMIWESEDLVHWGAQRMVELASEEATCLWAPEVYFDKKEKEFIVFWASMTSVGGSEPYHKMFYVKTTDFRTFTKPEIWIDYGYSVIDTTVIEHEEKIYRISKGPNIIQESAHSFYDQKYTLIHDSVESNFMEKGEGPIIFKSNNEDKWYLFIDEYGLRGYLPLVTSDLSSGKWEMPKQFSLPDNPRHGSVIPITNHEYNRLYDKYGQKRREVFDSES